MVTLDRWSLNTGLFDMKCMVKGNKNKSLNTSYRLIEVVTKAGLTSFFVLCYFYVTLCILTILTDCCFFYTHT
jgi:hypothetical protein